jgi:hypothetical protein
LNSVHLRERPVDTFLTAFSPFKSNTQHLDLATSSKAAMMESRSFRFEASSKFWPVPVFLSHLILHRVLTGTRKGDIDKGYPDNRLNKKCSIKKWIAFRSEVRRREFLSVKESSSRKKTVL